MAECPPPALNLLTCCGSCHTFPGELLFSRAVPDEGESSSSSLVLPGHPSSARGTDGADRAPYAAGGREPPKEYLIDTPPAHRKSAPQKFVPSQAEERIRLRRLVNEFVMEAARGRSCWVVPFELKEGGATPGTRQEARYDLLDEAERWVLSCRAAADASGWQTLGAWPLVNLLGAHRAEESALVGKLQKSLEQQVAKEELSRSAIIEFSSSNVAGKAPILVVEDTVESRERLVSALSILRLYRGAARRMEMAKGKSPGSEPSPEQGGPAVNVCGNTSTWCGQRSATPATASSSPREAPKLEGPASPEPVHRSPVARVADTGRLGCALRHQRRPSDEDGTVQTCCSVRKA